MRKQSALKAIKCAQRRQRAQRKSTEVKQALAVFDRIMGRPLAVFDRIMGRKRDTPTAKLPQSE